MANKAIEIMFKNRDSITSTVSHKEALKIKSDYITGCKDRKVYIDTEGQFAIDMNNVQAVLINKVEKGKERVIGFRS